MRVEMSHDAKGENGTLYKERHKPSIPFFIEMENSLRKLLPAHNASLSEFEDDHSKSRKSIIIRDSNKTMTAMEKDILVVDATSDGCLQSMVKIEIACFACFLKGIGQC